MTNYMYIQLHVTVLSNKLIILIFDICYFNNAVFHLLYMEVVQPHNNTLLCNAWHNSDNNNSLNAIELHVTLKVIKILMNSLYM